MLNNKPLITIITPTFNREVLLENAILSIIHQDPTIEFEREMLIIDDGSVDNTKSMVEKYIHQFPDNIQYFHQTNSWVWKARNVWLNNMSKNSDYLIFLDSDDELRKDCIYTCLRKWEELKIRWDYDKTISLWYYCITDTWKVIWNQNIFDWKDELEFTYKMYLWNKINWETGTIWKSFVYIDKKDFRFEEDIINEWVLRSKIWKWSYKNWYKNIFTNYIWRIYWTSDNQWVKITKTVSPERFRKNAIGNERILENIGEDLEKYWFHKTYSDYLFRAWINRVLYWEKKKWLKLIKSSLKCHFDLKIAIIYLLSILSKKVVLFIYKIYI